MSEENSNQGETVEVKVEETTIPVAESVGSQQPAEAPVEETPAEPVPETPAAE